ncbi:hypothetical protein B0J14DRAFT_684606 [Halenospora varia]|nr:hypothetical protein B0J14DRAFT_684606 [Halenospora varia]
MKLIIGGATGFVGKEVLRQALRSPEITSIVTLGRRAVVVSEEHKSKIIDIVMEAQEHFSDSVIEQIADADACIWTIAITLTKSKTSPPEEVKKVTRDYALAALDAVAKSNNTGKPIRFVYVSGTGVTRDLDQDVGPIASLAGPGYFNLRNKLEVELLEYAARSGGRVKVCCARPAFILGDRGPGFKMPNYGGHEILTVEREVMVAAMLKQCVEGIEMDPLGNDDLIRIGEEALPRYG